MTNEQSRPAVRLRLGLSVLLVGLCLSGCTSSSSAADLETHQGRWESRGIDRYKMTLAFSTPTKDDQTLDVLVRDGEVDRALLNMKRVEVRDDGSVDGIPATVDNLFELVGDNDDAETLTVAWDDELGYPTSIVVDGSALYDDNFTIEVRSLVPLDDAA
jgi:hypothetical protein